MDLDLKLNPNQIRVHYENIHKIQQACENKKISIISIIGNVASGKTFLVKNMINHNVGALSEPNLPEYDCGIWLSSEPVYTFRSHNGEEICILVMDTPGLFNDSICSFINDFIVSFTEKVSSIIMVNMFVDQSFDFLPNKRICSRNVVYVLRDSKHLSRTNDEFFDLPYPGFTVCQQQPDINAVTDDFQINVNSLFRTLTRSKETKKNVLSWNQFRRILLKFSKKNIHKIETTSKPKSVICNLF